MTETPEWKKFLYWLFLLGLFPFSFLILFILRDARYIDQPRKDKAVTKPTKTRITFHLPDPKTRFLYHDQFLVRKWKQEDLYCLTCKKEIRYLTKIRVSKEGSVCHCCHLSEKLHKFFLLRFFFDRESKQADVVTIMMLLLPDLFMDRLHAPMDELHKPLIDDTFLRLHEEFQLYPFHVKTIKRGNVYYFIFNHGTLKLDVESGERTFTKKETCMIKAL